MSDITLNEEDFYKILSEPIKNTRGQQQENRIDWFLGYYYLTRYAAKELKPVMHKYADEINTLPFAKMQDGTIQSVSHISSPCYLPNNRDSDRETLFIHELPSMSIFQPIKYHKNAVSGMEKLCLELLVKGYVNKFNNEEIENVHEDDPEIYTEIIQDIAVDHGIDLSKSSCPLDTMLLLLTDDKTVFDYRM